MVATTKHLIIILEDPTQSTTEHYLEQLEEELRSALAAKQLRLVSLKEEPKQ